MCECVGEGDGGIGKETSRGLKKNHPLKQKASWNIHKMYKHTYHHDCFVNFSEA